MKGELGRPPVSGEIVTTCWSALSVQLKQLLLLNTYYLLSVSQNSISRSLHSSPMRYELSLATQTQGGHVACLSNHCLEAGELGLTPGPAEMGLCLLPPLPCTLEQSD